MNINNKGKFGIIVSGGPAPGINSVISSSVIEAQKYGFEIKGLVDGFRGLATGVPNSVVDLTISSVSGIYNTGGSILGTTRFIPFHSLDT